MREGEMLWVVLGAIIYLAVALYVAIKEGKAS